MVEYLPPWTLENLGTPAFTYVFIEYLMVGTAWWLIWANASAGNIIKCLVLCAGRLGLGALTLATFEVESLPPWTLCNLGTPTFTFLFIENLRVWTVGWLVGTFAHAQIVIKYLVRGTSWFWLRAHTLASCVVEYLPPWTLKYLGTPAFTYVSVEYLMVGTAWWLIRANASARSGIECLVSCTGRLRFGALALTTFEVESLPPWAC